MMLNALEKCMIHPGYQVEVTLSRTIDLQHSLDDFCMALKESGNNFNVIKKWKYSCGYHTFPTIIEFQNGSVIRFARFGPDYIRGTNPNYILASAEIMEDDFSRVILEQTIRKFRTYNPQSESVPDNIVPSQELTDFIRSLER